MDSFIPFIVGAMLILFGGWFIARHNQMVIRFQNDADLSEKQRTALVTQHRRRKVATGLIVVIGFLIPLSEIAAKTYQNPLMATLILMAILLLVTLVFIYACWDLLASRTVREDLDFKKAETELKRRILEQELAKHQAVREERPKETRRNGSD